MYIKEILCYDVESQEADILVSDGQYDLLCYAQPFSKEDSQKRPFSISAFMTGNVMRALDDEYNVQKQKKVIMRITCRGK